MWEMPTQLGKGIFVGELATRLWQWHRVTLLSPSSCSATALLEMPMPLVS